MALNDVYEVSIDLTVKGEHCVNIWHLREITACMDLIPAKTIGAAVIADWLPDWAVELSDECTFNCVYVRRVLPTPGIAFTSLCAIVGGISSEPIPTTSAGVVSLYSDTAGPSSRGRKYLAGLPENGQNGGLLETAKVTALEALMAIIMTTLAGSVTGEWSLTVYSPKLNTDDLVIATIVRTNLGTMRTRRQRPGSP